MDSRNILHTIDEPNCYNLTEPLRNYQYDYVFDVLKVYSFAAKNQVGATYASAVHKVDGKDLQN